MTTRQARLARLRTRFVQEATVELAEVERLASSGAEPARLRKLVHDLRGSGGSYGFPAITTAAAALEAALPGAAPELVAALAGAIRAAAASVEPAGGP